MISALRWRAQWSGSSGAAQRGACWSAGCSTSSARRRSSGTRARSKHSVSPRLHAIDHLRCAADPAGAGFGHGGLAITASGLARLDEWGGIVGARREQQRWGTRDDQLLTRRDARLCRQVIGFGQIRAAHLQLLRDRQQRLAFSTVCQVSAAASWAESARPLCTASAALPAPSARSPSPEPASSSGEAPDSDPGWSGPTCRPTPRRGASRRRRKCHRLEVRRLDRRRLDVHAVLRRIAGDDHRRENQRHVVARLARQIPPAGAQAPEVLDPAGALDGALHPPRPAVVRAPAPGASRRTCRRASSGTCAAARVAFSGSARSSMYQSCFRPFSSAVPRMNCHIPLAFARDSASGLKALSTSGT